MDEIPRKTDSANSADNAPENLGEIFANDSYVKPELETAQSCNRHHKAKNKEDRWYRLLAKHLGNQAKEAGLHDWLIVFFTAVLTLVACL